jgi:biopolymer transport protein TolR
MSFGRFERTPAPRPMSEINMTPLVDVMLVLVVIFIITAPLLVSSIKVDLPQSEGAKPMQSAASIALLIDKTGQVFSEDRVLTPLALSEVLKGAAQRDPNTELQLSADATVPYGRVVEVMGLAQKAGLNRIGFVAESPLPDIVPNAR